MDEDYLIRHGPGLTWMDVKIGNYYPTPRANKAVEIQALWYNALRIMSNFANIIGKDDDYYDLSNQTKESFNLQYDQLYDVIDTKDQSIRPNQIFLVSLDYSMIDQSIKENIINNIELKLITPFGLRTLNPEHPDYKGNYIGIHNKDIAYHNGTSWPWLLGPFVHSFIKLKNYEEYWRTYAYEHFLKTMFDAYGDQWDGSIHEIFDGSPPYVPRGCITQAWSVAEILRCLVEDIENIRPPFEKTVLSSKIRA
jgi:glycogen debranching enzyme